MQWLVFAIIGAAVALGIRRMSREAREAGTSFDPKASKEALMAQDMLQCSVCQAYVVKGAVHCGRDDCPHSKPPKEME